MGKSEWPVWVVKIGGSLLDWSGLVPGLQAWLMHTDKIHVVLIVGGGLAADWIRRLDHLHRLPSQVAHWLAIETMRLNAQALAAVLDRAVLVENFDECCAAWSSSQIPILDPVPFCQRDVTESDGLPMGWEVTSDSIAAQVAWRWRAEGLVLMKACPKPPGDWCDLARIGAVDAYFPRLAHLLPCIRWLCLHKQE